MAETQELKPVEMQTVHFELKDHSDEKHPPLKVKMEYGPQFIEIYPDGYGTVDMEPGFGSPVALEWYKGKLRLLVNADINGEMEVIELEKARESNRIESPE